MRRGAISAALAAGALAALPAVAGAATHRIEAEDVSSLSWAPNAVAAKVGDTIEFGFARTVNQPHNVEWIKPGETDGTVLGIGFYPAGSTEIATTVVDTVGDYAFLCQIHPAMVGSVSVTEVGTGNPGDPPPVDPGPTPLGKPAPPPPLGNTAVAPVTFERSDTTAPALSGVKARGGKRSVALSYRLSEAGTVSVTLKRKGKRVKRVTRKAAAGAGSVSLRKLKPGRYTLTVKAADAGGLTSRSAVVSVKVRQR